MPKKKKKKKKDEKYEEDNEGGEVSAIIDKMNFFGETNVM